MPQLVVFITGLLGLLCLAAFLFLIDYAARLLRPVSLVKRVGDAGAAGDRKCLSRKAHAAQPDVPTPRAAQDAGPVERTILHRGTSGIILAVDIPQLIAEAEKANGVIEFAPQVGDFVGADEPLFLLHGGAAAIDDESLRDVRDLRLRAHAWSRTRCSAFRILVDIAIKALSAAINDPTTAVLAIDQLHRVLRSAGRRNLRADSILDPTGKLRVILRTPDWDDFVHLAFAEIRFYGASNVQIARRLRAMIVNLANTLPAERHAALRQELELLDRMLEKLYVLPEDLALARIPDSQGLGGSTDTTAPKWAANRHLHRSNETPNQTNTYAIRKPEHGRNHRSAPQSHRGNASQPISIEELKALGEGLFPIHRSPVAREVLHLHQREHRRQLSSCDARTIASTSFTAMAQDQGMWFMPGSGMGPDAGEGAEDFEGDRRREVLSARTP